ncbi:MAG: trypco2 family protein [Bacteroidales bacterium]
MELKEFIKSTLIQVSKGIEEAKMELGSQLEGKTVINPTPFQDKDLTKNDEHYKRIENIDFDIAVIVEQKKEGKAGIGVLASIVTAGVSTSSGNVNSETHRIKFKVPIKFA